ncbi:MAG TPA: prepilin-type N-terminal cleavage/methylation domain-containing protein [Cellvibrio sp.]|nr:prepilin-type N-terminal cleavage/methylation domain-containing protein [Cellvibrio sp.]
MKGQQSGFTLIELIAVIVILAILAVTALPKFIDLTEGAKQAAVDGVAGNLGAAMALNYAGAVAENAGVTGATHVAVDDCDDGGSLLLGGLPTGYVITAGAAATLGTTATCTLTLTVNALTKTATFTAIGAP